MPDYIKEMSEMIARSKLPVVGYQKQPFIPTTESKPGYGAMGAQWGAGMGAALAQHFDPERIKQEAVFMQEQLGQMDDEMLKRVYRSPGVQDKMSRYQKAMPNLVIDAGKVFDDPQMVGLFAFAKKAVTGAEEARATLAGKKATTEETMARAVRLAGEEEREAGMYPEALKRIKQETDNLVQQGILTQAQANRMMALLPLEEKKIAAEIKTEEKQPAYLEAKTAEAWAQAGYYDRMPKATETQLALEKNEAMKQIRKDQLERHQAAEQKARTPEAAGEPLTYAMDTITNASAMVSSVEGLLGYGYGPEAAPYIKVTYQDSTGQTKEKAAYVSSAMLDPGTVGWSIEALSKAWRIAFNNPGSNPAQLKALSREMEELFVKSGLESLLYEEVRQTRPDLYGFVRYAEDAYNKLMYMRYVANRDVMDVNTRKAYEEALKKATYLMPETDPSWLQESWMFTKEVAGGAWEVTKRLTTGEKPKKEGLSPYRPVEEELTY